MNIISKTGENADVGKPSFCFSEIYILGAFFNKVR